MSRYALQILILLTFFACRGELSKLDYKSREGIRGENLVLSGQAPLNFDSLQKYILKPKCMGCHSGSEARPENDPIDFTS